MTINLETMRKRLLRNPKVKEEHERPGPIYELVGAMIEARHAAGLTQEEVAERMGTTQSVVARLEAAWHMPTFDMATRYAAAIGRRIDIRLASAR